MDAVWTQIPQTKAYSYHPGRREFLFAVESHPTWTWLALESGRFEYRLGKGAGAQSGECHGGEWILCPPGVPLQRKMLEISAFHFARLEGAEESCLAAAGHGTLRDGERMRHNFRALRKSLFWPGAAAWQGHLLGDTFRAMLWERLSEPPRPVQDAEMQKAAATISDGFASSVSLEALARQARLTPSSFCKRFRSTFGQTPRDYLQEVRLTQARRLLLDTDLTLDRVASQCGFSSAFHLSRLWTRRYGVPPARFRREHRV